jgi:hypothetical protein
MERLSRRCLPLGCIALPGGALAITMIRMQYWAQSLLWQSDCRGDDVSFGRGSQATRNTPCTYTDVRALKSMHRSIGRIKF